MLTRTAQRLIIVAALAAPLCACSRTVRWPHLYGPGPAPYQRAVAQEFDPYPLPDLGPPLVGARPREFDKPRDEVERSQEFLRSVGAKPRPIVPNVAVPIGPPVAVGPPIPIAPTTPYAPATTPFVPVTPAIPTSPRY